MTPPWLKYTQKVDVLQRENTRIVAGTRYNDWLRFQQDIH